MTAAREGVSRDVSTWLRRGAAGILEFLFPPHCVGPGCGRAGGWLCSACCAAVRYVTPPLCHVCGVAQAESGTCRQCLADPPSFDSARAVLVYDSPIQDALLAFKFGQQRALAPTLAAFLIEYLEHYPPPDCRLVPVPLHSSRLRQRGYNQALLLSEAVGSATGLSVLSQSLQRVRHTQPQVDLAAGERRGNVAGAFKAASEWVAGHNVVLIDDIVTTGATMSACAAALKEAGAAYVWGLAVARPTHPQGVAVPAASGYNPSSGRT